MAIQVSMDTLKERIYLRLNSLFLKILVASRGRNPTNYNDRKKRSNGLFVQVLELIGNTKSATLTTVGKDNMVLEYEEIFIKQYPRGYNDGFEYHDGKSPSLTTSSWEHNNFLVKCKREVEKPKGILIKEATKKGYIEIQPGECFDAEHPKSKTRRGRKMNEKSNNLMANNQSFLRYEGENEIYIDGQKVKNLRIRRLTPTECARLQTIPTWYKWECSDTQQLKMLGNGWTIEVIKHFFSFLNFQKNGRMER